MYTHSIYMENLNNICRLAFGARLLGRKMFCVRVFCTVTAAAASANRKDY